MQTRGCFDPVVERLWTIPDCIHRALLQKDHEASLALDRWHSIAILLIDRVMSEIGCSRQFTAVASRDVCSFVSKGGAMKNVLAVALLCLLSLSLAAGQKASKSSVEDQIKKHEQDWAQAVVKEGAASVDQYEADDIITTDPSGRVTNKAEDKTDLSSGDYKIQSEELSDLKVHIYGNTAVAAATNTMKGTYKGQDLSGKYRFTDTWVKRNGKWQVVASQYTKVLEAWPSK
jgi:ketosteroid isomerase-like protein